MEALRRARVLRATLLRALLAACAAGLAACGEETPQAAAAQEPAERSMPVRMQAVAQETVVDRVRAVGSLAADESIILRPEIPGLVKQIHFEEGQPVEAGEVLVTLDATEYEARVAETQATVELRRLSYERAKDLHAGAMISKQEYDEAFSRLKESEAALRRQRALLDKTELRAPFAGIVGLRHVSPGAYVQPGQDLVNLEKLDPMKVEFRISERYAPVLRSGSEVSISVDAVDGRRFDGTIYAIDPRLDPRSRAFTIRARIPNRDHLLKPGMFARVEVVAARRPGAVVIPEEALWPQGERLYVYRVEAQRARLTPVSIGSRFDGKVEITQGLSSGDVIVTEGQIKIRDGMAVMDIDALQRGGPGGPEQAS